MLINEDDCCDEDLICRDSDAFDDGHTREEVMIVLLYNKIQKRLIQPAILSTIAFAFRR